MFGISNLVARSLGFASKVCSEDFSPSLWMRTKVLTTNLLRIPEISQKMGFQTSSICLHATV